MREPSIQAVIFFCAVSYQLKMEEFLVIYLTTLQIKTVLATKKYRTLYCASI